MILFQKEDILSEESKVVNTFNEFFSNIFQGLKFEQYDALLCDAVEEKDPVSRTIRKYTTYTKYFVKNKFFYKPKSIIVYFNVVVSIKA